MSNSLLSFTKKAMEFWRNRFQPLVDNTRRTATATEGLNAGRSSTIATETQVSDSATSVQLLAAAADRLGASFDNNSTAVAYLKWGTTASTSSYTVRMVAGAFYELPLPIYTGRIDCIWDSAAGGKMAITELGV